MRRMRRPDSSLLVRVYAPYVRIERNVEGLVGVRERKGAEKERGEERERERERERGEREREKYEKSMYILGQV